MKIHSCVVWLYEDTYQERSIEFGLLPWNFSMTYILIYVHKKLISNTYMIYNQIWWQKTKRLLYNLLYLFDIDFDYNIIILTIKINYFYKHILTLCFSDSLVITHLNLNFNNKNGRNYLTFLKFWIKNRKIENKF